MRNINFFLGGMLAGSLIGNIACMAYIRRTYGTLKIDHSNPEKDVYLFELGDIDALSKKKRIILKVDNNAVLSQK